MGPLRVRLTRLSLVVITLAVVAPARGAAARTPLTRSVTGSTRVHLGEAITQQTTAELPSAAESSDDGDQLLGAQTPALLRRRHLRRIATAAAAASLPALPRVMPPGTPTRGPPAPAR